MPKVNINSRDNFGSIYGVVSRFADLVSQPVNLNSDVIFNRLTLRDSLIVDGDFTVNGATTIIATDIVEINDNIIEINAGEVGSGVSGNLSGIQVNRGSALDYQFVFEEATDTFKIGQISDLQTVATREDIPLSNGIMIFNNNTLLLQATNSIPNDTTFNSNNSVSSITGAVRIQGGIGVEKDMFIDGKIYFKGIGYGNHISGNASNDLVLRADNDLNIDLSTGKNINIPSNVKTVYGANSFIENNTTDLLLSSGNNVNINSNSLVLIDGTDLSFQTGSVLYTNLDFTGTSLSLNSRVSVINSTASTSASTGALVVSGGVGISGSQESVSISNGGALTVAGGASVAKKLYVGGAAQLESDLDVLENSKFYKKVNLGLSSNSGGLTDPLCLHIQDFSYTDDVSSGTVFQANSNVFGQITLSASSSIDVNTSSTVYIKGPPIAGANTVLTDAFSLNVNSGKSIFGGDVLITSTGNDALVISGGGTIDKNLQVFGNLSVGSDLDGIAGNTGKILNIPSSNINDTGSGVSAEMFFNRIAAGTLSSDSSITTTNAATLVIDGSPVAETNQTITNGYALWVKSGMTKTNLLSSDEFVSGDILTTSLTAEGTTTLSILKSDTTSTNKLLVGSITEEMEFVSQETLGATLVSEANSPEKIFSGFKTPTINSVSSFTTVDSATLYVEGSPVSSGNHSITNSYSLLINSGDSKINGKIFITDTTQSTNPTNGALVVSGGVGISGNLFSENFDSNGATTLKQTTINTTQGALSVSGTNGVDIDVASSSNITVSNGTLSLLAESGPVIIDGSTGITIDTLNAVVINSNANSSFNSGSGNLTLSGANFTVNNTGTFAANSQGKIDINTTSVQGISIGTANSGIPVVIGNTVSETTIGNNLTVSGNFVVQGETTTLNSSLITTQNNSIIVNSMPAGLSDGGLLVRRYQIPNNANLGQVVQDTRFETDTFASNSSVDSIYLGASALSVNDHYIGWWIKITSGAGSGQVRRIKSYASIGKEAVIYSTSDNTSTFEDGLDLTTQVLSGASYNLYPGTYSAMFYNDTDDEWVIGRVPFNENSGRFPLQDYVPLHVQSLNLEEGIVYSGETIGNGTLILDNTGEKTLLVRKEDDGGDVFYIDTQDASMVLSSPSKVLDTGPIMYFNAHNNIDVDVNYSEIRTNIENNISGSLRSSMDFNLVQGATIQNYLTLDSNTGISIFRSRLNVLDTTASTSISTGSFTVAGGVGIAGALFAAGLTRLTNTTASTSTTTGALVVSGGVGIAGALFAAGITRLTNTTASTSISTGALVVSGGVGIAGALFAAGLTRLTNTTESTSSTTGALVVSGGVGVAGNISLSTSSTVLFPASGLGIPTLTTRSAGTKMVLYPDVSATRVDFAIGVSSDSQWYSVGNSTHSHRFYHGTTNTMSLTGASLELNYATSSISTTTGALKVAGGIGVGGSVHSNGVYTNNIGIGTTSTTHKITFNGDSSIGLSTNSQTLTITGGNTSGSFIEFNGSSSSSPSDLNLAAGPSGDIDFTSSSLVRMSVNANGQINITTTTDATDSSSGSFTTLGGASVGKKLYIGTDLHVIGSSNLGEVSTGTWNATVISVVYGGTGASTFNANSLLLGNGTGAVSSPSNLTFVSNALITPQLTTTDTAQATSSTVGPVKLVGGISVAKNAFIGTDLFTGGNLGVGTSTNVNSELTLIKNSVIGLNTLGGVDDGTLSITGGGAANASRGGVITLHGEDSAGQGNIDFLSGATAGTINLNTAGTARLQITHGGVVSVLTSTPSTSNSTGAIVSEGGIGIINTINSSSSTNGGSFTSAGGIAVAKDAYIGGDLYVSGNIVGSSTVATPTIAVSDLVNMSSATLTKIKVINNNEEKTLSFIGTIVPTVASLLCSFEFVVPSASSFTTPVDIVPSVQGFTDDYSKIENIVCYSVSSSSRAKVSFTSYNLQEHVLQFIIRYN